MRFYPLRILRFASLLLIVAAALCFALLSLADQEPVAEPQVPTYRLKPTPSIDESVLQGCLSQESLRLRRAKEELLFLGSMVRPDADEQFFFASKTGKEKWIAARGSKIPLQGIFLTVVSQQEAYLESEGEKLLFPLKPMPGTSSFEIDEMKVDGGFLNRQRLRYYGPDLFMARHGGVPGGSCRLEGEGGYTLYVQEGSRLMWKDHRWQLADSTSKEYPLLLIQKLEDKNMTALLFAHDQPTSQAVTLARYPEGFIPPRAAIAFRYIGAKNRSQWLFEVVDRKEVVKEGDWWLLSEEGWRCLNTPEQIDAYVNRSLIGELFIIEKQDRIEGQAVLTGRVFSASRTREVEIVLPLRRSVS